MEIKRRLTKIAGRLSPQIEAMNVAPEINRLAGRIDELITYAQTKIDRAAENDGKSMGQVQAEKRAAADKVIRDHQTAEAEENLKDQQEALDERNKGANKSKKPAKKKEEDAGRKPAQTKEV